jgi:hypothetical protein
MIIYALTFLGYLLLAAWCGMAVGWTEEHFN